MGSRALSDSGWFWATVFAAMALAGTGLIAGKFDARQRQVEGRYWGRQEAFMERERRAAGLTPVDLAESARPREEAAPDRIVPLWTLVALAAAATVGSAAMLIRERRIAGDGTQSPS